MDPTPNPQDFIDTTWVEFFRDGGTLGGWLVLVMLLGRAYHVIVNGGGIVGIVRALLYGTNVPKAHGDEKTLTNEEKSPTVEDHEKPTP